MSNKQIFTSLCAVLTGIAGFYFFGVTKVLAREMVDFQVLFSGAVAFAEGLDPYSKVEMRKAIGFAPNAIIGMQITLPGLFLVLRPLTGFNLQQAELAWAIINCLSISLIMVLLWRIAGFSLRNTKFFVFFCIGLFLGPFHTTLWLGNTDIVALMFCVLAIYCAEERNSQFISGITLGLAMVLKVHSTGLFAFYYLARGKLGLFVTSLSIWIGANLVTAALLQTSTPGWVQTWLTTVQSEENNYNKVVTENVDISQLIHLKAALYGIFGETSLGGLLAVAVCLIFLAWLLIGVFQTRSRNRTRENIVVELSAISLIGLLVVYHKFYGAVFIMLPIIWAVMAFLNSKVRVLHLTVVFMYLLSLFNGQIFYAILKNEQLVPAIIAEWGFLDGVLQFHFSWALMIVLIVCIYEQRSWVQRELIFAEHSSNQNSTG